MLNLMIFTTLLMVTSATFTEADRGNIIVGHANEALNKTQYSGATLPVSFSCIAQSGVYPDILDCRRFWTCNNWQPILYVCAEGQLYHTNSRRCSPQNSVNCGARPYGGKRGDVAFYCKTPSGVYPDISDCGRFWSCYNWQATLYVCAEGQLYDTSNRRCLPKNVVNCGTRPNKGTGPEVSTSRPQVTQIHVFVFTDNDWKEVFSPIQPTNEPHGRTEPPSGKSTVNWEVSKPTEVPTVSTVINGKDMLPTTQKPTLPDCETKSPNRDSTNNIGKTVFPEGDSSKDTWRTNFPEKDSSGGTWRTKSPNGDSSDGILRTEFPLDKTYDWTQKEIVTTASPIHSTQQLFTTVISPATTSNNFKESTLKPITTPSVYDYTRLTTIGNLLPEGDDKHFRCPAAFGIYPHPQDCSKYYVCVMAKVSVGTCKESRLYDVSTFQCQKRENVNCGTRFDPKAIEISFECPIAFGIYPHPRDCSKFVICFAGKVSFGDCHPTQRFDIRYYQCRIRNDVDCGDKFNP